MKRTRRLSQFFFFALTVTGVFILRGNAERWCPFGGVEALYTYVADGAVPCSLGVSNFFVAAGVVLATLLVRRAFCGYACPVGAIAEWVGEGGRALGLPQYLVPERANRLLSLLKYGALAAILYFTYRAGELVFRGVDPCYALLSRHGEDITLWAYVAGGVIVVGSLFLSVPFCRWLCPLAAFLAPFSKCGVARVKRDPVRCVDCGNCRSACPMAIPVDTVAEVRHARCTLCLDCSAVCPPKARGAITWGLPRGLSGALPCWVPAGVLVLVLAGAVAAASLFPLPSYVFKRGQVPAVTAETLLSVPQLTCRGRATSFTFFLLRDDLSAVPGYLKVEAWPGPDGGEVCVTFDPACTTEGAVREAITEPYFDPSQSRWRMPPFSIEGYDPFGISAEKAGTEP